MARRTFDVVDIIEILVHWHAGRNNTEIAASLNVDRKTVRKYVAVAEAAGMVPGGAPLSEAEWDAKAREWFPELADTRLRQVTWPAIEPHHEFIGEQLKAGVTVTTIHQRLRDEHGVAVSVASFRRYVAANVAEETRRSQVKVLRPWPAEPGAEAQIDYGRLGRWLDPAAGKPVTVWAFVMVLACSRHMFVRPVIRLDQQAWSECHVKAFAFFGGVAARLVPDNLKTGVERPDLYDPKINRSYAELAAHYGFLPDPARAFRPTDKPRVERPMPYVRDSFWRGREFASLGQMQAEAERWCTEVAGMRLFYARLAPSGDILPAGGKTLLRSALESMRDTDRGRIIFFTDCDYDVAAGVLHGGPDVVITASCDVESDLINLGILDKVAVEVVPDAIASKNSATSIGVAVREHAEMLALPMGRIRMAAQPLGLELDLDQVDFSKYWDKRNRAALTDKLYRIFWQHISERSEVTYEEWTARLSETPNNPMVCNGKDFAKGAQLFFRYLYKMDNKITVDMLLMMIRLAVDESMFESWSVVKRFRAWETRHSRVLLSTAA